MQQSVGWRLEQYTIKRSEVLIVSLETPEGEEDLVTIYRGFSSSLMRSTAFDPDIPIIAADSKIKAIDRLATPYDPDNPQYIKKAIAWSEMEAILSSLNL